MIRWAIAIGTVALAAAWVWAFWAAVAPASAHSWYDAYCCSDRDCRPALAGEIEVRADGIYVRPANETVPTNSSRIKPSLDLGWHICLYPGRELRCLYRPGPGM